MFKLWHFLWLVVAVCSGGVEAGVNKDVEMNMDSWDIKCNEDLGSRQSSNKNLPETKIAPAQKAGLQNGNKLIFLGAWAVSCRVPGGRDVERERNNELFWDI